MAMNGRLEEITVAKKMDKPAVLKKLGAEEAEKMIVKLRDEKFMSWAECVEFMKSEGYVTRRGEPYSLGTLRFLYARAAPEAKQVRAVVNEFSGADSRLKERIQFCLDAEGLDDKTRLKLIREAMKA